MEHLEEEEEVPSRKSSTPPPRRRVKQIHIPRRVPSIVISPRKVVYITPDKTTCVECPCYPKEDAYAKPKKLNHCQKSPLTLYELAAAVVDALYLPPAFKWQVCDVVKWICEDVGLPQYQECIIDNNIDGMRLLMLEDPSKLPMINIHDFEHIKAITAAVRSLYGMDVVRFARSHGLPQRRPRPHATWFHSRTGPSWGIRTNWTRCDILRWMKILVPKPLHLDHWELVWYVTPDFPKAMFARAPPVPHGEHVPHYKPVPEVCDEMLVPRRFRLLPLAEENQYIWVTKAHTIESLLDIKPKKVRKRKPTVPKETRLCPKRISCTGLRGKEFMLARRLMPKQKFFVHHK